MPEPLRLWIGKEEYGGVPTPAHRHRRPDLAPGGRPADPARADDDTDHRHQGARHHRPLDHPPAAREVLADRGRCAVTGVVVTVRPARPSRSGFTPSGLRG